jgi:hypothetical protein
MGGTATDVIASDGKVYDSDRLMFLRAYLGQLQRATAKGVPVQVHGYVLWSAHDNLEWVAGYGASAWESSMSTLRHCSGPEAQPSGSVKRLARTPWCSHRQRHSRGPSTTVIP